MLLLRVRFIGSFEMLDNLNIEVEHLNLVLIVKPDPFIADGPNQVWTWDITYLASTVKGSFFYLYLFMDLFSRKIVGWEVHDHESAESAAQILRKTKFSEGLSGDHELVLHSDNGSPMKGAKMLATMQKNRHCSII